jgi:hypothetical protein
MCVSVGGLVDCIITQFLPTLLTLMLLSPSENFFIPATTRWAPSLLAILSARSIDPGPVTTDDISVNDLDR